MELVIQGFTGRAMFIYTSAVGCAMRGCMCALDDEILPIATKTMGVTKHGER